MTETQACQICPLCGFQFKEQAERCGGCPIAIGCETICCPQCNYQFVSGSRLLRALHRLFNRSGRKEGSR